MHTQTYTSHLWHTVWARIACEALLLRASLIQCIRIVIINQTPLNKEKKKTKCFCVCESASYKWSTSKVCWKCESRKTRVMTGGEYLPKNAAGGSNTPGMIKSWGGQENRRREEDKKDEERKEGVGKESSKGKKPTGLHTISYSNRHWIRILYKKV